MLVPPSGPLPAPEGKGNLIAITISRWEEEEKDQAAVFIPQCARLPGLSACPLLAGEGLMGSREET